jgi:transcriptional/translational regulatory protein YebC/TACO1
VIKIPYPSERTGVEDLLLEALLEHDVEVVEIARSTMTDDEGINKDIIIASVQPDHLSIAQDVIEKLHYSDNMAASVDYVANELINLSEDQHDLNLRLIEGLESLDDVDRVFHNMRLIN